MGQTPAGDVGWGHGDPAVDPLDPGAVQTTSTERDEIRQDYSRPGRDRRVLRLLDELERVERELAGAVARVQETEARLVRKVHES
jgi:hypothetical protein